jgi:c-di-GMP-related signal transduction protein
VGLRCFQGYFFAKPVITSTRQIPTLWFNHVRTLRELYGADLDADSLARLIARELGSRGPAEVILKALAAGAKTLVP